MEEKDLKKPVYDKYSQITASSGLLLPPVFAIATGLPVIIIAWIETNSIGYVGRFDNKMNVLQKWCKRINATVFIVVGMYYIIINI